MFLSRNEFIDTPPSSIAEWNRRPRVMVVGLGDSVLTDQGVGIHAVRRFLQIKPPQCLAMEIGTAIANSVSLFENAERVLAFDSLEAGEQPGSVYVFRAESSPSERRHKSLHEVELIRSLQTLPYPPDEVVIIAAEPYMIGWGAELSPVLDSAVSIMVSTACEVIAKWQSLDLCHDRIDLASIIQDSKYKYRNCIPHFKIA